MEQLAFISIDAHRWNGKLNLTTLKDAVAFWKREAANDPRHLRFKLVYNEPTTLYYGNKTRWLRDKEYLMRNIFFLGSDGLANNEWEVGAPVSAMYYVPIERNMMSGWLVPLTNLDRIELLYDDTSYRDRWAKIAASMRKYNINPSLAGAIEQHLEGKTDTIEGTYRTHWDKPRTSSFSDVFKAHGVEKNQLEYIISCMTKSNYGDYKTAYLEKRGKGGNGSRDRSVAISENGEGSYLYSASSEYYGCGNGDYYAMYSPTMALFMERD